MHRTITVSSLALATLLLLPLVTFDKGGIAEYRALDVTNLECMQAFAIEQPADVDVNEIIVRPIGQSG
jgi:hypothetical protein